MMRDTRARPSLDVKLRDGESRDASPTKLANAFSNATLDRACPKELRAPPFLIGVAGGTASGKTTVCEKIREALADDRVVIISMDNFYRPLTQEERANVEDFNFDHPSAFDEAEIARCLDNLKRGRAVNVPIYDFATHARRADATERVEPAEVILFEGILVLHMATIVRRLNMKIYVDTDDDLRLSRRILRDVEVRGRDVKGVIRQYTRFVKPAQDTFVTPSRRMADVIIPWHDRMNLMAVDLVTKHLQNKLQQHPLVRQYPNLDAMRSSPIIKEMHTRIRDAATPRTDFVFYADRLIRLVVEAGLGYLPFRERSIVTPEGHPYVGVDFARSLCGVSIIRSGEAMEGALRDCCAAIKIGKILVHRERTELEARWAGDAGASPGRSGSMSGRGLLRNFSDPEGRSQPQPVDDVEANIRNTSAKPDELPLVYCKLPEDIAERHVLLMDPILSSGYTIVRAIEALLDRDVREEKIYLLCLIAAPQGIHAVCKRFPRMRVLVSEIDSGMDEHCMVVPGIGEFGNRYFSL